MKNTATLFIDESGKASLAEKKNEPFLITGVIINNDDIQTVEGFFNYIKRKYQLPLGKPFHSYDIYENPKTKLSPSLANPLSGTLADYISLIPIQTTTVVIDKEEFKKALGVTSMDDFKGDSKRKEMKDYPYRVMVSYLFAVFGFYPDQNNYIGQIIADSRRGADYHVLKTLSLCKEGIVPFKEIIVKKAVRERISAICFAEKGFMSGGLEITDLISYVSFFRARRLISSQKDIGIDLIWDKIRENSKYVELRERAIRRFFGIKPDGVHKYLKS